MQKQVGIVNKCKERLFTYSPFTWKEFSSLLRMRKSAVTTMASTQKLAAIEASTVLKPSSSIIFRSSNDGVSEFSVARATGATLNFEMSRSIAQQTTVLQRHH